MKISGCIITKDEENNIERCINSLKPVVSEIIVVDTGSSDNTVDIAKKLGAKVYHFEWVNDFSKAKNYAISKATGNWIIFLDADEYLEEESASRVISCINEGIKCQAEGLYISLVNYDNQHNIIQSTIPKIQIFKRDRSIRYFGAIHEMLKHEKRNIVIHDCSNLISIIHTGYSKDEVIRKNKGQRNIDLLIGELKKNNDNFDTFFYLAESYAINGDMELGLYYALRASNENKSRILGAKEKNYLNIIKYMMGLKYPESMIEKVCTDAIKLYPNYPDYYIILGNIYAKSNKNEDAIIMYEKALSVLEGNSVKGETQGASLLLLIYKNLSELYYDKNDFNKAVHVLTLILKTDKYEFRYLNLLMKILLNNGELEENITDFLNRLYDLTVEKDLLLLLKASINNGSAAMASGYMNLLNKANIQLKIEETEILLLQGDYEKVVYDFLFYYNEDKVNRQLLIKALTAAILSRNNSILDNVNKVLEQSLGFKLRDINNDTENENYNSEELELIVDIIKELKRLSKYDEIEQIVIKTNQNKILLATSEIFYHEKLFNLALSYYDAYIQNNQEIEDKQLYIILYKMSNCLYQLGEYNMAKSYIENSFTVDSKADGYGAYTLLLRVIENAQSGDDVIKDVAGKAIALYPDSRHFISYLGERHEADMDDDKKLKSDILKEILYSHNFLQNINEKASILRINKKIDEAEEIYKFLTSIEGFKVDRTIYNNKTSIIILTYNNLEYNKLCVESIRKHTKKDTYEIIVVDNNSTDGTVEWLKEQNDIKLILNDKNLGFPKGCNQGIEAADEDNDILLLNNDTVVTPNWLINLHICLYSQDDIGAVGSVTNSCSNYQAISVDYGKNMDNMVSFAKKNNISNELMWEERLRLVGFCMLIKAEVLKKVGLLDERFTPGNFEDDDYSFRIRKAGYRLLLCKDSFIHHFGSVSFGKVSDEYQRLLVNNRKKFEIKWGFDPHTITEINKNITNLIINESNDDHPSILHIGCAGGGTLLDIKYHMPRANIYGIEFINEAYANTSINEAIVVGDIEKINQYSKDFFDFIFITIPEVGEQLIIETWSKIRNYLSNSGKFFMVLKDAYQYKGLLETLNKEDDITVKIIRNNDQAILCLNKNVVYKKNPNILDYDNIYKTKQYNYRSKIYILCPANVATGGPELLHQLCYKLTQFGYNASMYYYGDAENPVHDNYKIYKNKYVTALEDSEDNVLVIPEINYSIIFNIKKCKVLIWWMSVDNFVIRLKDPEEEKRIFDKINGMHLNKKVIHLVQSQYANNYLINNKIPSNEIYYLSDYLNYEYLKEVEGLDFKNRRPNILYNPKKGYEYTSKLIKESPELNWIPLINLTPKEMVKLMKESMIYIDFGNHPGKDRIPREAAICGCCVITGKKGAAKNNVDIRINNEYKFEENSDNITVIIDKIKFLIKNYKTEIQKFEIYRQCILSEERKFDQDVMYVFGNICI